MDYLFSAPDAVSALATAVSGDGPSGPLIDAVPIGDLMPSPHIEQLAGIALGQEVPLQTAGFVPLTAPFDPDSADQAGPTIQQLPDALRDLAAGVTMTADIARQWAAELWGHGAEDALMLGGAIADLARRAKADGRHLYAWWTL